MEDGKKWKDENFRRRSSTHSLLQIGLKSLAFTYFSLLRYME